MQVQSKRGSAVGLTQKVHKQALSGLSPIDPLLIPGPQGDDAATAKSGYFFAHVGATATPANAAGCTGFQTYTIVGRPANVGQSGQRGFFSDQSGVIRYTTDGSAPTIASPPLQ